MSIKHPGSYLRTNYRLTGKYPANLGALESLLIHVRQTAQLDSAISGYVTLSVGQVPSWAIVDIVPNNKERQAQVMNACISGSLLLVSFTVLSAGGSIGIAQGSMAATVSYAFEIYALIGSR